MWISEPMSYLTYEQALNNANIVFNFFKDKGYTKEAISGILGNMWRESHVNPNLGEESGSGYGLTQWTPKSKLMGRLSALGLSDNGDNQLKVLEKELGEGANNSSSTFSQWYDTGSYTLTAFKTTTDIDFAVEAFCYCYERPGVVEMEERKQYAHKFYTDITGEVSENGGYQLAVLPCRGTVYITQAEGGDFSHLGSLAVDFAYSATKVPLYAPFDMICVYKDSSATTVWQSDKEVKCADGSISYVTMNTIHSDDWNSNNVGDKKQKGEVYAYTGTSGNVTGDHTHIEASKGIFTTAWYMNPAGRYSLPNPDHLYNIFSSCNNVTKEETTIINQTSTPMPWVCVLDWVDGSGGSNQDDLEDDYIILLLCDALNGWKW